LAYYPIPYYDSSTHQTMNHSGARKEGGWRGEEEEGGGEALKVSIR